MKELTVKQGKANLRGKTHSDLNTILTAKTGKTQSERKAECSQLDQLLAARKTAVGQEKIAIEQQIRKLMGF